MWNYINKPKGAVTPWRFSQRTPSVFRFFGKRRKTSMAVFLSLGMRWGRYTVVGERGKTFERRKIFKHARNFFLGPTFANVWEQTLWNVCKTLCKRYEIVQFVRLSFRMRLTIVRKRWYSFALYITCFKGWADQLCAGGVGTPWRMRESVV